ncbi:MAG: serine hydrolase domain-containing protein, partial [Bacteroidota bacterium]|nr:serine hydrolase domain-containing protein [Bacteroidota bacterium]
MIASMLRRSPGFLALLLLASCQAPLLTETTGLRPSASAVDLAQDSLWAPMEAAIRSTLETNGVPGAVLLVARNGEVVGHEAFGEADPLAGDPMTMEAQFRICSQTKAITAMAAMVLWERGQLGLDEPVSNYLPEFADIGVLDTLLADSTGVYSPPAGRGTSRTMCPHRTASPTAPSASP